MLDGTEAAMVERKPGSVKGKGRLLALLVGCALTAALAIPVGRWLLGRASRPAPGVPRPSGLEGSHPERSRYPVAWNPATAPVGARHLPRFQISESIARQLFPIHDEQQPWDEHTYLRRPPNLNLLVAFPEHPGGKFRLRTNSFGMRQQEEPSAEKPDLRILATGDAHTEGVCNTFESFTKVLQLSLSKAHRGKTIEALNAGKGSFTFYNYLGTLEKFLYLEPDVFVVGVGPNDFEEVLQPYHYFAGAGGKPTPTSYLGLIQKARELDKLWLSQDGLSLKLFQQHPEEVQVALRAAKAAVLDIQELCQAHAIQLVFVYIPGLFDTHRRSGASDPKLEDLAARLYAALELSPQDLGVHDRMADELIAFLAERGIPALDAREVFAGRKQRFFWLEDHHIDVAAQRAIGEALAPIVEATSPPGLR